MLTDEGSKVAHIAVKQGAKKADIVKTVVFLKARLKTVVLMNSDSRTTVKSLCRARKTYNTIRCR